MHLHCTNYKITLVGDASTIRLFIRQVIRYRNGSGFGNNVAIETTDAIIQTNQASKIVRTIKIGRSTRHVI